MMLKYLHIIYMYNFIINPWNKKNIKITSKRGKLLLKKYIKSYLGGAEAASAFAGSADTRLVKSSSIFSSSKIDLKEFEAYKQQIAESRKPTGVSREEKLEYFRRKGDHPKNYIHTESDGTKRFYTIEEWEDLILNDKKHPIEIENIIFYWLKELIEKIIMQIEYILIFKNIYEDLLKLHIVDRGTPILNKDEFSEIQETIKLFDNMDYFFKLEFSMLRELSQLDFRNVERIIEILDKFAPIYTKYSYKYVYLGKIDELLDKFMKCDVKKDWIKSSKEWFTSTKSNHEKVKKMFKKIIRSHRIEYSKKTGQFKSITYTTEMNEKDIEKIESGIDYKFITDILYGFSRHTTNLNSHVGRLLKIIKNTEKKEQIIKCIKKWNATVENVNSSVNRCQSLICNKFISGITRGAFRRMGQVEKGFCFECSKLLKYKYELEEIIEIYEKRFSSHKDQYLTWSVDYLQKINEIFQKIKIIEPIIGSRNLIIIKAKKIIEDLQMNVFIQDLRISSEPLEMNEFRPLVELFYKINIFESRTKAKKTTIFNLSEINWRVVKYLMTIANFNEKQQIDSLEIGSKDIYTILKFLKNHLWTIPNRKNYEHNIGKVLQKLSQIEKIDKLQDAISSIGNVIVLKKEKIINMLIQEESQLKRKYKSLNENLENLFKQPETIQVLKERMRITNSLNQLNGILDIRKDGSVPKFSMSRYIITNLDRMLKEQHPNGWWWCNYSSLIRWNNSFKGTPEEISNRCDKMNLNANILPEHKNKRF